MYYKEHGVGKASTEFNVSSPSIYKWDKEFNGEQITPKSTKSDKQLISQLERKVLALQKLVADNALELRIKDELLKKRNLQRDKNGSCTRFYRKRSSHTNSIAT